MKITKTQLKQFIQEELETANKTYNATERDRNELADGLVLQAQRTISEEANTIQDFRGYKYAAKVLRELADKIEKEAQPPLRDRMDS
tara:strand:+ start:306 stop:566 length:261 start_codon:yes stop_codon:yes gene_type:complete